jgi:hypothetical protein
MPVFTPASDVRPASAEEAAKLNAILARQGASVTAQKNDM